MADDSNEAEINDNQEPKSDKIDLILKAAGDAPILKRKKWLVERIWTVSHVIQFLKGLLKCGSDENIFLFCNLSFAPSLDTDLGSLYDCYNVKGKLIVHYCKTPAWG
uniref:Ubiquitin-like protein ATG12 n=1 Tax=Dugesia japonica TaxID=6161 RepID=A0A2P1E8Q2_DUGJA|nr:Atg12 [Dugesia japonica]